MLSIDYKNFTCQNYFSHFRQASLNVHPIKFIVVLLRDKTLPTSPMQFATHQHTFLLKGIFPNFCLGKRWGGGWGVPSWFWPHYYCLVLINFITFLGFFSGILHAESISKAHSLTAGREHILNLWMGNRIHNITPW